KDFEEFCDLRIAGIEARVGEPPLMRVVRVNVLIGARKFGEAAESFLVKPHDLADFSDCRPAPISDDISGHCRAELAIALVNVLNHAFTAVAAWQIQIDVGPFAALFGKESLEEQLHPNRVDCGNSQRVANRAIGSRAPTLDQNAVIPAEIDDVP